MQCSYTELCKIIPAKFRELSLNFPKLADWLCMGWASCLVALRREIQSGIVFYMSVHIVFLNGSVFLFKFLGCQGSDPKGEKPLENPPENSPENQLEISYTGKSPKIGSLDMS